MSSIMTFIEGYMNGDAWEELCVSCYRLKYQTQNYTAIPAVHGGDAGIEGFTCNGIVHQCYCPEREYDDKELYEHQRDKLTADIEKLMNNGERLKKLGVGSNTPLPTPSRLTMTSIARPGSFAWLPTPARTCSRHPAARTFPLTKAPAATSSCPATRRCSPHRFRARSWTPCVG